MNISQIFASNTRFANQEEFEAIGKKILHINDDDFLKLTPEQTYPGIILQVGFAPRDIEIEGSQFRALCNFRFTGSLNTYQILIEGSIEDINKPHILSASLLAETERLRRAA
jgi:hypothetical protein